MDKRIEQIYKLRNSFSIIGLTGRKGAGVDSVAEILSNNFSSNNFPIPKNELKNNKDRKYKITYDFYKKNWRKYTILSYKKVLFFHLLKYSIVDFSNFLRTNNFDFSANDYNKIKETLFKYNNLSEQIKNIGNIDRTLKDREKLINLSKLFFGTDFNNFVSEIEDVLKNNYPILRIKFLQKIANNLRQSGNAYNPQNGEEIHIYTIAEIINRIIKGYKYNSQNKETHITINSLRNSLEIMFFKERYSAFYMIAVNSDKRRDFLENRLKKTPEIISEILELDENEYSGVFENKKISNGDFYIQDVQNCIQKSDIYLSYNPFLLDRKEYKKDYKFEKYKKDSIKSVKSQILKYASLILHPGLITPSAQERCMHTAFNAKSNSGCISRQVGAVITDDDFSIKSIGWNDVPVNTVPCLLKSANNLINGKDLKSFSPYEKGENDDKFNCEIKSFYSDYNFLDNEGYNHSYCFKDFENRIENEKNQVHTRSLHAEENAMMQIAKYGGQPLKKGILFSTASPCELCSKKARQLEIHQIYYIDPYPGIAKWHILRDGDNIPELILFAGAVGRAFNRLFEPIMAYKDELVLISGKNVKKK